MKGESKTSMARAKKHASVSKHSSSMDSAKKKKTVINAWEGAKQAVIKHRNLSKEIK